MSRLDGIVGNLISGVLAIGVILAWVIVENQAGFGNGAEVALTEYVCIIPKIKKW